MLIIRGGINSKKRELCPTALALSAFYYNKNKHADTYIMYLHAYSTSRTGAALSVCGYGIRRVDCDDDQLSLAALGRSGDRHVVKAASLRQKSAGVGGGSSAFSVCLCGQPGTGCGAATSAVWHGSAALYLGKVYETAASLCIMRHRYYLSRIYSQLSGKCNPERAGDGGENAGVR